MILFMVFYSNKKDYLFFNKGVYESFKKDLNVNKVNLTTASYNDNDGRPYILESVRKVLFFFYLNYQRKTVYSNPLDFVFLK